MIIFCILLAELCYAVSENTGVVKSLKASKACLQVKSSPGNDLSDFELADPALQQERRWTVFKGKEGPFIQAGIVLEKVQQSFPLWMSCSLIHCSHLLDSGESRRTEHYPTILPFIKIDL